MIRNYKMRKGYRDPSIPIFPIIIIVLTVTRMNYICIRRENILVFARKKITTSLIEYNVEFFN